MKQMSLIEMDGFLKGKFLPRDLKVNETNAEYLVRKFGELESKLETALRECRSAGITIDNLEAKCAALAAESAGMKKFCKDAAFDADYEAELGMERGGFSDAEITAAMENKLKINMERQWPEPKDGEPRLHIKEPGNYPVTPGGWISCSDRMPEDTKMLLAFSQGEIVAAYWNWVVNPIDYKKYRAFTYLSGNILDDVTHWMPLPEPPQQDGE